MTPAQAQAQYRAARAAYHAEWVKGESPALIAAEAARDAAWANLCAASRSTPSRREAGALAAHRQLSQLALDDA